MVDKISEGQHRTVVMLNPDRILRTEILSGRAIWGLCMKFDAGTSGVLREIVMEVVSKNDGWFAKFYGQCIGARGQYGIGSGWRRGRAGRGSLVGNRGLAGVVGASRTVVDSGNEGLEVLEQMEVVVDGVLVMDVDSCVMFHRIFRAVNRSIK